MNTTKSADPNEGAVEVFWKLARERVGWDGLEVFLGQRDISTLRPPAVCLSDDAEEATQLAEQLRASERVELKSPREDYLQGGSLPERGDLLIVCDGKGRPVTLACYYAVEDDGKEITETLATIYPLGPEREN